MLRLHDSASSGNTSPRAPSSAATATRSPTSRSTQGGFDLAPFPAVRTWLARVAAQPRHIPITD